MQETASGLRYEVITEGTGKMPAVTDTVVVHYTGTLTDGTKFDSSRDRGEPISFPLNGVIAGWTEGLQLMKEGARYKLYIPADLGYGAAGAGGAIPPNADLIFDVELLEVAGEAEPHPDVIAFLKRGIPEPTCGAMPTLTGGESDAEIAALRDKGNEWQNCMAQFIKAERVGVNTELGKLQNIDSSQVPSEQQQEVGIYLQRLSSKLDKVEEDLAAFKGIAKS